MACTSPLTLQRQLRSIDGISAEISYPDYKAIIITPKQFTLDELRQRFHRFGTCSRVGGELSAFFV